MNSRMSVQMTRNRRTRQNLAPSAGVPISQTEKKLIKWQEDEADLHLRSRRQITSAANKLYILTEMTKKQLARNSVGGYTVPEGFQDERRLRAVRGRIRPCHLNSVLCPNTGSSPSTGHDERGKHKHTITFQEGTDFGLDANFTSSQRKKKPQQEGKQRQMTEANWRTPNINHSRKRAGHRAQTSQGQPRQINARRNTKLAQFYFQNRPTCLKRTNDSDDSSESHEKDNVKKNYSQLLMASDGKMMQQQGPKYVVKDPYHEDRDSYNLTACIQESRKPIFGYPLPDLFGDERGKRSMSEGFDEHQGFDLDFMKPNMIGLLREKSIMDHVLKCFTWGKPVRRDIPLSFEDGSRINEIKRKFNRVRLIRQYFSVKRRGLNRKFIFPIDQLGRVMRNHGKKQDYQQYCIESDFEHEYPRRNKAQRRQVISEVCRIKKQQLGIDMSQRMDIYSNMGVQSFDMQKQTIKQLACVQSKSVSKLKRRQQQNKSISNEYEIYSNVVKAKKMEESTVQTKQAPKYHQEYGDTNMNSLQQNFNSQNISTFLKNTTGTHTPDDHQYNVQIKFNNQQETPDEFKQVKSSQKVQKTHQRASKNDTTALQTSLQLFNRDLNDASSSNHTNEKDQQSFKQQSIKQSINSMDIFNSNDRNLSQDQRPSHMRTKFRSSHQRMSQEEKSLSPPINLKKLQRESRKMPSKSTVSEISLQKITLQPATSQQHSLRQNMKQTSSCNSRGEKSSSDLGKSQFYQQKNDKQNQQQKITDNKSDLSLARSSQNQTRLDQGSSTQIAKNLSQNDLGYYSDREFEHIDSDAARSYCSSIADYEEGCFAGKSSYIQPYDFDTSRRTKRFFCEDYLNLTLAATDREYAINNNKKDLEQNVPHLLKELSKSQLAYKEYFQHLQQNRNLPLHEVDKKGKKIPIDPYQYVQPESPTWQRLQKKHEMPETIKNNIDRGMVKEIPETTAQLRKANQIPIKLKVDKQKITKEYRRIVGQLGDESSDSEYEQKNLKLMLNKKHNKGVASLNVLKKVENRLSQPKETLVTHYGQRSQHLQSRDHTGRIIQIAFCRGQQDKPKFEKRKQLQKLQVFKQGLSNEQLKILKDRQFVIVDKSQIIDFKKKKLIAMSNKKKIKKSVSQGAISTSSKASMSSIEESSPDEKSISDDSKPNKSSDNFIAREQRDLKNFRNYIAKDAESKCEDFINKNQEFNRDVRTKFNRYKREMRERQKKLEEDTIKIQQQEMQKKQELVLEIPQESQEINDNQAESSADVYSQQSGVDEVVMQYNLANFLSQKSIPNSIMTSQDAYGAIAQIQKPFFSQRQDQSNYVSMDKSQMVQLNSQLAGGGGDKLSMTQEKRNDQRLISSSYDIINKQQFVQPRSGQLGIVGQNSKKVAQSNSTIIFSQDSLKERDLTKETSKTKETYSGQGTEPDANSVFVDNIVISKVTAQRLQNAPSSIQNDGGKKPAILSSQEEMNQQPITIKYQANEGKVDDSYVFNDYQSNSQTDHRHRASQSQQTIKVSQSQSLNSLTNLSNEVYRHVPSRRLSPIGDLINQALDNVPKLPAYFNKNDLEVKGVDEARGRNRTKKKDQFFSKFLLERMKQSSILNHECFKKKDVDYKAKVAENLSKYKEVCGLN